MKRTFDLLIASLIFMYSLPLFMFTSVLIRIFIGKGVLFKQVRPGKNGYPFKLYKFRTMTNAKSADGELLPDHLRMTKLGSIIRSSSIDELPQLVNVIKGDLSLVGPRPLLMEYLPLYNEEQRKRHDVKPGITGWAQINGRNTISWDQKFRLDVWYVENQSFKLDLYILYKTFQKVIQKKDISAENHVTVEKFRGNN
ncbi:sugar transferase [Staphylococcus hyicus]|uniref:Sugar transferase n=2 Tax=Staphylococcus hyicus TaxID=1284 RepID=A0A418JG38_STAHY|nr:sugar transferase [Staphylococcus hyicus]NJH81628.1 sugar transferase [Staphylococcus hyicus]RIO42339.1 sugar transferase [Staphylococcus hyicus]